MAMARGMSICLDVGITQTRAWAVKSREIVGRAKILEGIRGAATDENRPAAMAAIQRVIAECLGGKTLRGEVDFIAAAGMITSELGPYPLDHIQGPAGMKRLSERVVQTHLPIDAQVPFFLVPGIRFGNDFDFDRNDSLRGEETLVMGMLASGHLAPGDALLNLGSHWKLISTNAASEIAESYTGMGGELMLAVSRETILKSNLPKDRPEELVVDAIKTGRERAARHGIGRTLFLSRMDSQRRGLTAEESYWQLAGALIEDSLIGLRHFLKRSARAGISGYRPLAEAWADALRQLGIESRIFSEDEIEIAFCAGLKCIVASRNEQAK
jgi:2-dehydro-3-deoxygalactonokinase